MEAQKTVNDSQGEIIIYPLGDGRAKIDVSVVDDTVWLTQQQMAELFRTARTSVVEHIKHIYEEGELEEQATCRKFRQVRQEGARQVTRELPHPWQRKPRKKILLRPLKFTKSCFPL